MPMFDMFAMIAMIAKRAPFEKPSYMSKSSHCGIVWKSGMYRSSHHGKQFVRQDVSKAFIICLLMDELSHHRNTQDDFFPTLRISTFE